MSETVTRTQQSNSFFFIYCYIDTVWISKNNIYMPLNVPLVFGDLVALSKGHTCEPCGVNLRGGPTCEGSQWWCPTWRKTNHNPNRRAGNVEHIIIMTGDALYVVIDIIANWYDCVYTTPPLQESKLIKKHLLYHGCGKTSESAH